LNQHRRVPPRLFFLHVPKTAGTSLIRHCERDFWPGAVYELPDNDRALEGLPRIASEWPILCGHQSFPFADALRPDHVVSMLREPVMRCVSAYEYVLRTPNHPLHIQFQYKGRPRPIRDVACDAELSFHFGDMQTRMIGADFDMSGIHVDASSSRFHDRMRTGELAHADGTTFARAARRLTLMPFVGISDRFRSSLELFARVYGVPLPQQVEHLKHAPVQAVDDRLAAYTTDDIALLRAMNDFDSRLYDEACSIFAHRLADQENPSRGKAKSLTQSA
jgi:hypothetical protein